MSDEFKQKDGAGEDKLGSLAQNARRTSLKQARVILILIGLMTAVFNGVMLANAESEVKAAVDVEKRKAGPGVVFDESEVRRASDTLLQTVRLIYGGSVALGVIFVVLGVAVYRAPVFCTITGLVLYLAGTAMFAVLEPESLARGIIIKVFLVIGLFKAVQAALAYEREMKAERDRPTDEFEAASA